MTIRQNVELFFALRSERHFVSWPVAAQTLCKNGLGVNWKIHRAVRRGLLSVRDCGDGTVVLTKGPRLLAARHSS